MNDTIRSFLTLSFASALCVAHAAPAAAAVTGSVDVTIDGITIDGDAANPNGDRFGYSLAAGDVNGDGHRDLVVGATKAETVYVFLGPITEPLDTTKASGVYHGFTGGEAGWSLAVGDIDGDGRDNILIGEPSALSGAGYVQVLSWPYAPHQLFFPPVDLGSHPNAITGGFAGPSTWNGRDPAYAGWDIAVGDFDGDGLSDVLIGACGAQDDDPEEGDPKKRPLGAAYFVSQKDIPYQAALLLEPGATATVFGVGGTGCSVAAADFDGDGTDEAILGSPLVSLVDNFNRIQYVGAAHVVSLASTRGAFRLANYVEGGFRSAPNVAHILGEREGGQLGRGLAGIGDINADGFDDLLLGEPAFDCVSATGGACANPVDDGRGYVVLGGPGLAGVASISAVSTAVIQGASDARLAHESAGVGDLDGDGADDFLLGSATSQAYLFSGENAPGVTPTYTCPGGGLCSMSLSGSLSVLSGTIDTSVATAEIYSPTPTDYLGLQVAGVGDIDGDGLRDLALGAPRERDYGNTNYGAGFVSIVKGW